MNQHEGWAFREANATHLHCPINITMADAEREAEQPPQDEKKDDQGKDDKKVRRPPHRTLPSSSLIRKKTTLNLKRSRPRKLVTALRKRTSFLVVRPALTRPTHSPLLIEVYLKALMVSFKESQVFNETCSGWWHPSCLVFLSCNYSSSLFQ